MSLKKLAKQVKKEQKEAERSFEELFLSALDGFFVRPSERSNRPQRLAFRPSSYYKCMRQTFYFLKNVKDKKKRYPRSERILQVGTALHEWIQTDVFMEMDKHPDSAIRLLAKEELPSWGDEGIEFIQEHQAPPMEVKFVDTRWTEVFPVSAMVDGALTFRNQNFLFEFKTINKQQFETMIEPLVDHIKQGAIYSLCTGITQVMFLYLCKDNQEFKAYLVTYGEPQLEWVKNRLVTTEDYAVRDELPPKEESDQCKWCGYKALCEKDSKGDES